MMTDDHKTLGLPVRRGHEATTSLLNRERR